MIQLIIVQILAFIGMVFFLKWLLTTQSLNETKRLQQLNEENAQKSQELARKLLDAENDYKQKMRKAEDEVRQLKTQAHKEIEDMKEAIISRGKAESEHIIAEALSSKKEMRSEIEGELKEKTVGLSCDIFRKVLSSPEQKLVYDGMLITVFAEMEELDAEQLKSIDLGEADECAVDVRTSHPMNPEQKEKLELILSSKLGKKIRVDEEVDKNVISGIIIQLNSFVIDGSLTERFRRAAEEAE